MNWARLALIACVAALAWTVLPRRPEIIDTHAPTRQLIIASTLARMDDVVIILGDSIVEASTLPRSHCGHPIVNAGIGGASTGSHLDKILADSLGTRRAAMVVVALGTNDAAAGSSVERYRSNYLALLGTVTRLTPHVAILAIPAPEAGLPEGGKVRTADIDDFNSVLPGLAEEVGATFIDLPAMAERHTVDGIHLNAAGYDVWDRAVLNGIDAALCKSG
jgi:lysophospholipase L1-like esterase